MTTYVADFETTTVEDNCKVWGFAISEVGNKENLIYGTSIDEFMDWCKSQRDNPKIFFHNLKFDGQFIMPWLFHNGFEHVSSKDRKSNTFTTVISDKGLYYAIEVIFYLKGKNVIKVTFQDSLKLIPLSVREIGKTFNIPELQKLKIDYNSHNYTPIGTPLTDQEKKYLKNDVQIVAHAIEYFYSQGLDRITIGSCALAEYKSLITTKNFNRLFPVARYHDDVKQSYRGGFTYLNPKFESKILKNGIVLDVNSLYPYVMYDRYLPYGTPIFFKGKYRDDSMYPIYTQMIRCQFEIKPDKIPTVQIKNSLYFAGNEYLKSSNDEEVVLCLNSVDLKLFLEHYDVYNLEYISGWKFKATKGLFDAYIEKWNGNKIKAKEENNDGMYLISKLFLNSLYGKFGTGTRTRAKIPYLGEDDVVHFKDADPEAKDGVYIAMASFITSYAREITIRSAQKIMDDYNAGKSKIQFAYADTDSLHCISDDFSIPEGLHIHDTELGAWKFESKFNKAKFIRQKCYIENSTKDVKNENPEYELKVTVAGMPSECYEQVNFTNFKVGKKYHGKKQPHIVAGGVVLRSVDFTIKK